MPYPKSTPKDDLQTFQPQHPRKFQNSQSQTKFTGSNEKEN